MTKKNIEEFKCGAVRTWTLIQSLYMLRENERIKLECVYYNVKQYLKLISALLSLKHYNGCKMTNNEYELSIMFYLFIYLFVIFHNINFFFCLKGYNYCDVYFFNTK